jgi:hypothetical protein
VGSTETAAAAPGASASASGAPAPSGTAAAPAASTVAPPERADVARAAAAALATHRARLVSTCWAPSLAKAKDPPEVRLMLNVTFGPDGKQLARGISETRGALRADVTACVQRELPALEIAPPGVQVETEIPLAFP